METTQETNSFPTWIAWISACLVVAAYAPEIEAQMRDMWGIMGTFGLASAVGLEAVRRARTLVNQNSSRKQIESRIDRQISQMSHEHGSEICDAGADQQTRGNLNHPSLAEVG